MVQLVSKVGVIVGVAESEGPSEVGLLVRVAGNGVTDGKGVKVSVGVRTGVWVGLAVGV
jgi:hypothetical protein